MKKQILKITTCLILTACSFTFAQYKSFEIEKPYDNISKIDVVQIDFREFSTLVHFQLENFSGAGEYFYIGENFFIEDSETNKKYKLLNSFNIPLENSNQFGFVENFGDKLNFSLEFEKVPENIGEFDLIEMEGNENAFNIYGVNINKEEKFSFLNLDEFIDKTPLKTVNYYFKDGTQIKYFENEQGLQVALFITFDNNYGKYLRANVLVRNLSGNQVNINPDYITAEYISKYGPDQLKKAEILSYGEYMKKVKRRQNWNAFAQSFSESLEASNAGYSTSSTNTSVSAYSSSYGVAYGYNGNSYSSAYGASYSYGNAYANSQTTSYDGSAAYNANQNAKNNVRNFQNHQYKVKQSLSEGYLKRNTIMNETEYLGYLNIPYSKKMKKFKITVPINGETYVFIF